MHSSRLLSGILAAVCLTAAVLSCASCGDSASANNGSSAQTAASADAAAVTTEEETSPFVADDLPELDLGGENFGILVGNYNDAYWTDVYAEEETGNRFNDAVYAEIQSVQERLNVKLDYSKEDFTWDDRTTHFSNVTARVLAGDSDFDLYIGYTNFCTQMAEGAYFIDLSDTAFVDLSKPWYNQSMTENMPTGYIFSVMGDYSIGNVKNTFAMYVNTSLAGTLGKDIDWYGNVDSGVWTIDKLEEAIADTYADIDGDGSANAVDRYGLTFGDENKYMGFTPAFRVKMFEKNADGGYDFTYDSERCASYIERITKLVHDNENVTKALSSNNPDWMTASGGGNNVSKLFMDGRSLITCALVCDSAAIIPNIDFEYALLPYPKWDEAQEDYYTVNQRRCYASIPACASDTDMSSAVLEALSSEGYRSVLPEYCEVTLKTRYAANSDIARMFDLIGKNNVIDAGDVFSMVLGSPSAWIKECITNSKPWASYIEAKRDAQIAMMEDVVASMEALG